MKWGNWDVRVAGGGGVGVEAEARALSKKKLNKKAMRFDE
jgi:hypothetical protein